jgi:hypothetical protein
MNTWYEDAMEMADTANTECEATIVSLRECECPVCEHIRVSMLAMQQDITEKRAEVTQSVITDATRMGTVLAIAATALFANYRNTAALLAKISDSAHEAYDILRTDTINSMTMGAVEITGHNLDEVAANLRQKLADMGVSDGDETPTPTQPPPKGWN